MKKILFFSLLFVSSIILVASCESGPSKSIDTTIGPNGCTCTIGATAIDKDNPDIRVSTTTSQDYERQNLIGFYTDCRELEPFLQKQFSGISVQGRKADYITVACLPK